MTSYIHFINLTSVGLFGMILSAAFCDILWTAKKGLVIAGSMAAILIFQGMIYFWMDSKIITHLYPLITHVPLAVVLCILNRKCLWPTISVLTAYLCCQIRRWLALLAVTVFSGGVVMQNIAELAVTLPILWILLQFIAPSVRSVSHYSTSIQYQFGLVPALYYAFDYLTRIYTSVLLDGVLVAVEFMPFVCSIAYLVNLVQASKEERIRSRLEQMQDILNLQITQAVREIESLRESQEKVIAYRHDLRHHMQYLSSCIENGRLEQARTYIQEISSEIEASKVTVYCENEVANLIFSAFARRAENYGIPIKIEGAGISRNIPINESDLCVLLSNALENALNACQKRMEKGLAGGIEVLTHKTNRKVFLQIINSFDGDVVFDHGIPVANKQGHGIGVRSICAVVDRYGGMYDFSVKGDKFFLRVSFAS